MPVHGTTGTPDDSSHQCNASAPGDRSPMQLRWDTDHLLDTWQAVSIQRETPGPLPLRAGLSCRPRRSCAELTALKSRGWGAVHPATPAARARAGGEKGMALSPPAAPAAHPPPVGADRPPTRPLQRSEQRRVQRGGRRRPAARDQLQLTRGA
jgi:hypothetical protein